MGIKEVVSPAFGVFGDTFSGVASSYWWVLFVFVGIAFAIAGVVIVRMMFFKKKQWTHKLVIRKVLQNNLLSKPMTIKMRRFPLIQRAEVFELEDPLLGGYLMPELEEYSDVNEFSIILDKNNRIYTNRGEFFAPDKASANVSAKHAEIDIARAELRSDFQEVHRTSKRVEWATIAKIAMWSLLIIALMIVGIVAIGEWGDAHKAKAQAQQAQVEAFSNLAEAMETSQATVNTQLLILDKLKELYGTNNIQGIINNNNNGRSKKHNARLLKLYEDGKYLRVDEDIDNKELMLRKPVVEEVKEEEVKTAPKPLPEPEPIPEPLPEPFPDKVPEIEPKKVEEDEDSIPIEKVNELLRSADEPEKSTLDFAEELVRGY